MNSKQSELDIIAKEIKACKLCRIGTSGISVPGEGNPNADIVFIGEAPGRIEAKIGRPFIGRSGQLLREMIRSIGLMEQNVYITSPVKYLPNQGTPSSMQIRHGRVHLLKQISVIQPKLIVLLGRVAIEGVLDQKRSVMKEHGTLVTYNQKTYALTLHPAAALRFPKFKKIIHEDFIQFKNHLPL